MSQTKSDHTASLHRLRSTLAERLRARLPEFAGMIFAHIRDMPHPAGDGNAGRGDVEYEAGLHAAVTAAIDYSFMGIEHGDEWSGPIPPAVAEQARRAARSGVSITILLLRTSAARVALRELIIREADQLPGQTLRKLLGPQELLLNAVMDTLMVEHERERDRLEGSAEQRRADVVRQLLAGTRLDASELRYEFDAWHIGVVASGKTASNAVRDLAARLDRHILRVPRGEEIVWAWLGGQRKLAIADVERVLSTEQAKGVSLAIGEPGQGIDGWRLTHRQAQEALLVSLSKPQRLTRYADVLLLAAVLGNDTHARSLQAIYLSPLASQRDGGAALRKTLSAYFARDHNVNATAGDLEIDRGTVRGRLRKIEQLLGCSLHACQAELEVSLRLEELRETPRNAANALPASQTYSGAAPTCDPPKGGTRRGLFPTMGHHSNSGN